ncbi:MAG: hypothetical protein QGG14_04025 [Planctomycetota bacterium]|jgi:tetratricopeptide (TPR) repeat protein|nr:hypothetical protein [Planctomycetota bacterium]
MFKRPETLRRVVLYSAATAALSGLLWAGFVYPSAVLPDAGTLLEVARMHLGMAQVIPEQKDGKRLEFRSEQLKLAVEALAKVEQVAPGLAITRELRAYGSWIAGDFDDSLRWYEEVLQVPNNTPDVVHKTRVNLAMVRLEKREFDGAIAELDKVSVAERDALWHLSQARVWQTKGDVSLRAKALAAAVASAKQDEAMLRSIADTCYAWGDSRALTLYQALEQRTALVLYRIALLEAAVGNHDSAREALKKAHADNTPRVAAWIKRDKAVWAKYEEHALLPMSETAGAAAPTPQPVAPGK